MAARLFIRAHVPDRPRPFFGQEGKEEGSFGGEGVLLLVVNGARKPRGEKKRKGKEKLDCFVITQLSVLGLSSPYPLRGESPRAR